MDQHREELFSHQMGISPNTPKKLSGKVALRLPKILATILREHFFTACLPLKAGWLLWKSKSIFIKNEMVSKHKNTNYFKTFQVKIS